MFSHLDESIREIEYKPELMAGSNILTKEKVTGRGLAGLFQTFRSSEFGERKAEFDGRVRFFLAHPTLYEVAVVTQQSKGEDLALVAYDRSNTDELVLPILRISGSKLAETVLRYLLREAVLTCAKEGRSLVRITDNAASTDFGQAFVEAGFACENQSWIKFNVLRADTALNLLTLLREAEYKFPSCWSMLRSLGQAVLQANETHDSIAFAEIERRLWPGKVSDANIPTYIIPVQPYWAQNLFDENLARQTLWRSQDYLLLVLRNENVYYRSARSSLQIASPARILWYVSQGTGYQGTKSIRACSSLDEVIVGSASYLYRRFKRLGVYKWKDILSTSKGDPSGKIMALRFSNTRLFATPISLRSLRDLLAKTEGKAPLLQAPQRIGASSFSAIHSVGTREP